MFCCYNWTFHFIRKVTHLRRCVSVFACDKILFKCLDLNRLDRFLILKTHTFYWTAKKNINWFKRLVLAVVNLSLWREKKSSRLSFFRLSKEHLLMFSQNWLIFFVSSLLLISSKAAFGMCVYVCLFMCAIGAFKPIDRNVIQMRIKMILFVNIQQHTRRWRFNDKRIVFLLL